jgi:hypothetical protein
MTNQKLQAFHNNPQLQQEFLSRSKSHYDADELIHGVYWENGKGCAYGCMTHSRNHKDLESLYGMPEWLGRLIDVLFEGMSNKHSKKFYLDFIVTVANPSFLGFSNWQHMYHQLCIHISEKECKNIDHPLVRQAIHDIIILHKTEETDKEKWSAAESAESAAWSAESAVRSAMSAVRSVRSTAWSTRSAMSAVRSVRSTAWSTAESATYKSIADKLLELLKAKHEIRTRIVNRTQKQSNFYTIPEYK